MSTSSTDPRTNLLLLWTSLPPIQDGSTPDIEAKNTRPHGELPHEQLLQIYSQFTTSCSDNIKGVFEKTLRKDPKRYPWEVTTFEAGLAWFEAFAKAALEIKNFFGEEKAGTPVERLCKIKAFVKVTVTGQNRYVDDAFGAAAASSIEVQSTGS